MDSYDFEAKDEYRARVWNHIENQCATPKALRTVVYLDTREALETVHLLRRGYRPENLLAVNREPVEVALLTMRLKKLGLPRVMTAGVEWRRAISDSFAGRRVDVVNFDGTGCLSFPLIELVADTCEIARRQTC